MQPESFNLISLVLTNDKSVSPEQRESILRLCRQDKPRRKLIKAKDAMGILDVSRPTLRAYVRAGFLSQINLSPRKIRFDEGEVNAFAAHGNGTSSLLA